MMKKGKRTNLFSEPLLHFIVAIVGLSLIVFLPDPDAVCEGYKRFVSTMIDIGIGLFPTGLIGLILVFMQKSQKSNEKFDQRISLLKELDIKLHNLVNEICKLSNQSEKSVKKILIALRDNAPECQLTSNVKSCATAFSTSIKEFLQNKNDFLLTEMFSTDEMEALSLLTESLDAFASAADQANVAQKERSLKNMVGCVQKLLKKIPEFSPYLKCTFTGGYIQ